MAVQRRLTSLSITDGKKVHGESTAIARRRRSQLRQTGRARSKPVEGAERDFFQIVVRDANRFKSFRTQKCGRSGHIQRVAGKRKSGSWATQKWLISKNHAHIEDGTLVADTEDVQRILGKLATKPVYVKDDVFAAKPRRMAPHSKKPALS